MMDHFLYSQITRAARHPSGTTVARFFSSFQRFFEWLYRTAAGNTLSVSRSGENPPYGAEICFRRAASVQTLMMMLTSNQSDPFRKT